jgi:hypothetical protein
LAAGNATQKGCQGACKEWDKPITARALVLDMGEKVFAEEQRFLQSLDLSSRRPEGHDHRNQSQGDLV